MSFYLGISAFYHDSAAALVSGEGEIVAAAQEERFSRIKGDASFPAYAVAACLREAGITVKDLDAIAFYDKPLLKFERLIETYIAFAPRGLRSFLTAMPVWLGEKLWMERTIRRATGYEGPILYPEHHESHAASAFYPSPFERAAILTVDGVGEWSTTTWGTGAGSVIDLRQEIRFPHSLGLLYSAFTYATGFRVNSGEYKVMGLAPYGEPRYVARILEHLIDLREDGSFRLNMTYFDYAAGLRMTNARFDRLFDGPPRAPEAPITRREMDLARSVQDVIELAMLRLARHVRRETGERALCLAGGVALNSVANGRIVREGIFDEVWIQPAAGDAGGALGAALFAAHVEGGAARQPQRPDAQQGSYLGPAYSAESVEQYLTDAGAVFTPLDDAELLPRVAEMLDAGQVVGWFSGRMEYGPRALGARSILGDPRSPRMQDQMNRKIKFRESFRPFAPACLAEDVGEWFTPAVASPYMLLVVDVRDEHRVDDDADDRDGLDRVNTVRSIVPAVTHVDHSARVQTVDAAVAPRFHALIAAFKRRTGVGMLINTSFNVRGEPIVENPAQAHACFLRTDIDALVVEHCLLLKADQPPMGEDIDWRAAYPAD